MPFSTSTRSLRMLQIGSVVLPMIVLTTWGFWAWHMEWARAVEHAETNVELVQQYQFAFEATREKLG